MSVPVIVLDGSMPYGSHSITTSGGLTLILDDVKINRPVADAMDRQTTGAPNRSRYTAEKCTGTATAQAPSGTASKPKFGDTFTATFDDNYGAELWVFMPVEYEASNDPGQVRKLPVAFNKVYNGSVTVVN